MIAFDASPVVTSSPMEDLNMSVCGRRGVVSVMLDLWFVRQILYLSKHLQESRGVHYLRNYDSQSTTDEGNIDIVSLDGRVCFRFW